jgi:hypothetical protein
VVVRFCGNYAAPAWLALLIFVLPPVVRSEPSDSALSPCTIHYPSDDHLTWACRKLKKGEKLEGVFSDRWVDVARFNRIDRRHAIAGVSIKVPHTLEDISTFSPMPLHHPEAELYEKFVLIDLSEQFLGAYEHGALRFSLPITTGERGNETPAGKFRITAAHRFHPSTLYTIEGTTTPYPMTYALRFLTIRDGVSYWIHGRDVPGKPASHGCIGLYDEAMQQQYYGNPHDPKLHDAQRLYEWVLAGRSDDGKLMTLDDGPPVLIIGIAPGERGPHTAPASPSPEAHPGCTHGE